MGHPLSGRDLKVEPKLASERLYNGHINFAWRHATGV
jgi:hypothetical protein